MTKRLLISILLISACLSPAFLSAEIPSGSGNFLEVCGTPLLGDPDGIQVVFFEIPDSVTSTLYFAIDDPECTGAVYPDSGGPGNTTFALYGGSEALSGSTARSYYFGSLAEATQGTLLDTTTYQATAPTGSGWHYFAGVSPSQGEHIGNKYYFKIVASADGSVGKNGFKAEVSLDNTQTKIPTGLTNSLAFAYTWNLSLDNQVNGFTTWNLYPFVPDLAGGNVVVYTWDFEDTFNGTLTMFDIDNVSQGVFTGVGTDIGGEGTTYPADAGVKSFPIASATNGTRGTWRLKID